MTLIDFVDQFVRVYNVDEGWYLYESGTAPELLFENLLKTYEGDEEAKEYYCKRDFTTIEEALEHEPGHFIQDLINAAWLTCNETTYDDADEDILQVESFKYEVCIGQDYEIIYETEIDLRKRLRETSENRPDSQATSNNTHTIANKGMTQIKLFMNTKSVHDYQDQLERDVNAFLKENAGKIVVKDIKYTVTEANHDNPIWKNWTVMVIYEVK